MPGLNRKIGELYRWQDTTDTAVFKLDDGIAFDFSIAERIVTMTQIDDKHAALLASGTLNLGDPVGPEETLYDGGAMRPHEFGRIYFHPRLPEALELHGLILATYLDQGAELSGLGYPVTDEIDDPSVPSGRMNVFEQGSLR